MLVVAAVRLLQLSWVQRVTDLFTENRLLTGR